jgi:hypothetical protein
MGVLEATFEALAREADLECLMIDSAIVRALQQALSPRSRYSWPKLASSSLSEVTRPELFGDIGIRIRIDERQPLLPPASPIKVMTPIRGRLP